VAGCREAPAVEDDELGRDVAHCLAHARPRLLPVAAAHLRQLRFLTAGVLADETDVLGVDVDAIATLELDDEPVARDIEHLARFHAEIPADAVHAVHDEVSRRKTLVVVLALARAARRAVHPSPPGEIRLGDQREMRAGQHRAAVERRDDDIGGRADFGEDLLDARLGTAALGGDEHAETVLAQSVDARREPVDVTDDRIERGRREYRRVGVVGRGEHEHSAGLGVREQTLERQREARRGVRVADPPRRGKGLRERGLLVEQLLRPIAQPARLHDRDQRARRQEIGEEVLLGGEPRQPGLHAVEGLALGEPFPVLATPRIGAEELGRPRAHVFGRQ
jgi:hypothetical protein